MLTRSAIAREAHRTARFYRSDKVSYATALSWGFKGAWRDAKESARRAAYEASLAPEYRGRRDEAIAIQCSADGALSNTAIHRLTELAHAA